YAHAHPKALQNHLLNKGFEIKDLLSLGLVVIFKLFFPCISHSLHAYRYPLALAQLLSPQ
ncbi:MAG: hypothetical protein Q8763_02910, partial [Candidatus Phytoplasma australasiaticum]|nr:hypothetical protein [Candidatus Phytoplasma australasiaticum]